MNSSKNNFVVMDSIATVHGGGIMLEIRRRHLNGIVLQNGWQCIAPYSSVGDKFVLHHLIFLHNHLIFFHLLRFKEAGHHFLHSVLSCRDTTMRLSGTVAAYNLVASATMNALAKLKASEAKGFVANRTKGGSSGRTHGEYK